MVKIFLDAMGGDNAPDSTCQGAVEALRRDPDLHITLGGDLNAMEERLKSCDDVRSRLSLVDAPEIISNHESPALGIRQKKKSAVVVGMTMLKEKAVDGFVSAGSTGATLMGGMLRLGRIEGIERPALAPLMPNGDTSYLLVDCGANVDSRPEWLVQFGAMGDAYMKGVKGIEKPRIGLVNNGAEAEKGNTLYKEAHQLMLKAPYHFVGNIEARYIPANQADVIVCDGFDGNIILKYMEGLAKMFMDVIKQEMLADTRGKLGALLVKPAFKRVYKKMDYNEIGGAPLLGLQGSVVKAHGSSSAKAIASAVRQAVLMVKGQVVPLIEQSIQASN